MISRTPPHARLAERPDTPLLTELVVQVAAREIDLPAVGSVTRADLRAMLDRVDAAFSRVDLAEAALAAADVLLVIMSESPDGPRAAVKP